MILDSETMSRSQMTSDMSPLLLIEKKQTMMKKLMCLGIWCCCLLDSDKRRISIDLHGNYLNELNKATMLVF